MSSFRVIEGQWIPKVGDIIEKFGRKLRVIHVDMFTVLAVYV